jgi:hypothetical protein
MDYEERSDVDKGVLMNEIICIQGCQIFEIEYFSKFFILLAITTPSLFLSYHWMLHFIKSDRLHNVLHYIIHLVRSKVYRNRNNQT